MSGDDEKYRASFADFTEESYAEILRLAKRRYAFARFGDRPVAPHVLWRHDVDFSPHRGLRFAELEHEAGVRATYFLYAHSPFYNLFEEPVVRVIQKIIALGHDVGLHFDATFYGTSDPVVVIPKIETEKRWLRDLFDVTPVALSYHLFGVLPSPPPRDDVLCGMVNAYGHEIWSTYDYCSDSNGVWRFRRLHDVVAEGARDRLQVLTHPEWWTPEAMPPRARIQRCIDGRATATAKLYDDLIEASKRPNVR